jgi:hypothetical protein
MAILIAGIAMGVLIGFAIAPSSRSKIPASAPNTQPTSGNLSVRQSDHKVSTEKDRVLLGDITTVPFQELYNVLSARSPEEIAQLVQQLRELPPGRETKAKIVTFFKAWARLDAKAAFTAAISFKSLEAKDTAIGAVLDGADTIVASSLAASIAGLPPDTLSPTLQMSLLGKALIKWSQLDPVAAAKFLDASPIRGGGLMGARISIAENWSTTDPQGALAWAEQQGDGRDARLARSAAITGWWHTDPRAAEAYVISHLDGLGPETIMSMTRQLFNQDPQRAKEWVTEMPDGDARRSATSFIAVNLTRTDPKGATEWAASLPDDIRERALNGTINEWFRKDPDAAAQWVDGLVGKPRDEAISAYSLSLSSKSPEAALGWATGIADAKTREMSVERIVGRWLSRSPSDATTWIQSSSLSAAEKSRLLALPRRR